MFDAPASFQRFDCEPLPQAPDATAGNRDRDVSADTRFMLSPPGAFTIVSASSMVLEQVPFANGKHHDRGQQGTNRERHERRIQ
jgi:hypothetical protein